MKISKTKISWSIVLLLLVVIVGLAVFPLPEQHPIRFVDRDSGLVKIEKVAGERWLQWLYNNPVGEATLWGLAKRKMVSSIYGNMMDRPSSAEKIEPFVEEFDIDLGIAQKKQFKSFNDFFTRKLKNDARPIDTNSNVVVSPADGKVLVYPNILNSDFIIKGFRFDIYSFLNDSALAQKFFDGSMLVIRLAPNDYHRFHFPVAGNVSPLVRIEGDYYSVNPIALRKKAEIFCLNKREYVTVSSQLFGDVLMAEVGATMVGSIVQTYKNDRVTKGEEKGFFKFGGSTVVLLFEKNKIQMDSDFINNTMMGIETTVKVGERIGTGPI